MKPKQNRTTDAHTSQPMDRCYTPAYALDPLLPYVDPHWTVWECAAGQKHLVRALASHVRGVIDTDVIDGYNFFTFAPARSAWDAIVTNPPYSVKVDWIERCYALRKPFALLIPVETLGLGRVQRLMEKHGAGVLLLDKRVNFIMPNKGASQPGWSSSAQFPVYWHTWKLGFEGFAFGRIVRRPDEQTSLFDGAAVLREVRALNTEEPR